jgi:hypothetical protein
MKKKAEINIGLSSKTLGEITPKQAIDELLGFEFNITTYRVVPSSCADGAEDCLAARVELPDDWQARLARIAEVLGQECIGVTLFVGADPYDSFDPSLWVTPEAKPAKAPLEVNGWTLEQFKSYLLETIIPDSRESGFDGYAEDLETALAFIKLLEA